MVITPTDVRGEWGTEIDGIRLERAGGDTEEIR